MNNIELTTTKTTSPAQSRSVSSFVMERIDREAISPTPRWRCLVSEYSLWFVWGMTVAIGALALSVMIFVVSSAPYALYEATHENLFTFLVDSLPLIWIGMIVFMVFLATVELRHTKRGYRYTFVTVVGSSVGLSILGAFLLHGAGFGFWFDHTLGERVALYTSFDKMEKRTWHKPAEGRYVGVAINTTPIPMLPVVAPLTVQFTDIEGSTWTLVTEMLSPMERDLLTSYRPVRIIGTSTAPFTLYLCGVLPNMFDVPHTRDERLAYKEVYLKRAADIQHRDEIRDSMNNLATRLNFSPLAIDEDVSSQSPCASVVMRHSEKD